MLQLNVFPGGVKRVVTFSYDDGPAQDAWLCDLFRREGVKGTFHLNADRYRGLDEAGRAVLRTRYEGMEIACHTVSHGWPTRMPAESLLRQVWEDRQAAEALAGYPVRGMSYPSGDYDPRVEDVLRACGIVYSRTVRATGDFALPEDFLAWHPTAHHRDAQKPAEKFMQSLDSEWSRPLLYIWGHGHELRTEEDFAAMEKLVKTVSGDSRIWYATNIEIVDYLAAAGQLIVSADERILHNPTATDVWVERDKTERIRVPAGETVRL